MQEMIGSAGMLRGWMAVWNMQMLGALAALTIAISAAAMIEMLVARRYKVLPRPVVVPVTSDPLSRYRGRRGR